METHAIDQSRSSATRGGEGGNVADEPTPRDERSTEDHWRRVANQPANWGWDALNRKGAAGGSPKPRLLDLFCKEGGASRGYVDAGFDVVGVDINPQPRYPYTFLQTDAVDVLADLDYLRTFDVLAGSPPCQAHSALGRSNPHTYADFIPQTRAAFQAAGLPYVIENVVGAPLIDPVTLCGSMFGLGAGDYQLLRHRLFETNIPVPAPPCRHDDRPVIGVYGNKARCRRRGNGIPAMGTNLPKQLGEQAMGIDWMTINGLSEAIPPAYSKFMGEQVLAHVGRRVAA